MHHRVVILGSGPAGLTAAIYVGRAGLEPVVVEGWEPGGQLTTTTEVENFPGFPEGLMGPEMMDRFRAQAKRFGAKFMQGEVERTSLSATDKRLWLDGGEEVTCDVLIIATGASARWLGLESESRFRGWGVSSCATCDGAFFKGEVILVVGGGDSAMEEALYLTRFGKEVQVVHRRDELRASQIMQDRALAHPKISFRWSSALDEVLGTEQNGHLRVTGARIRDLKTGEVQEVTCGAVFVAIGHTPNTSIFQGELEMDEAGYLVVAPHSTKTDVPGVFAAGDVSDHVYRQAITAAGTGCMAAIDAERYLGEREEDKPKHA